MVVTYARWPFCQRKIKLFNPELGRAASLLHPVVVAAAAVAVALLLLLLLPGQDVSHTTAASYFNESSLHLLKAAAAAAPRLMPCLGQIEKLQQQTRAGGGKGRQGGG